MQRNDYVAKNIDRLYRYVATSFTSQNMFESLRASFFVFENVAAGVKFNKKKNDEKFHISTSINKEDLTIFRCASIQHHQISFT